MKLESERRRFVGANVKRTLTRWQVRDDLAMIARHYKASVIALQEFQTRGHWLALRSALEGWKSYPSVLVGLARPSWSGQAIAWRHDQWRRLDKRRRELHQGAAGITETRQLRAVLLEDRRSGLACWFATTHFVVGGDQLTDGPVRRHLMAQDLTRLDKFIRELKATGHAGVLQLDANLTPASDAWATFQQLLRRRGCTIHGVRGVEYLITWQASWTPGPDGRGRNPAQMLRVSSDMTIGRLNTDHEARALDFRLERTIG